MTELKVKEGAKKQRVVNSVKSCSRKIKNEDRTEVLHLARRRSSEILVGAVSSRV